MLELWEVLSSPLLPSLPGPIWAEMVAPERVVSMGQIKLNSVLILNWIAWNRTVSYLNVCKQKIYSTELFKVFIKMTEIRRYYYCYYITNNTNINTDISNFILLFLSLSVFYYYPLSYEFKSILCWYLKISSLRLFNSWLVNLYLMIVFPDKG